jgi:chromate reductase
MHILAIIGSLRKASYNRMAFEAARTMLPPGVTMDAADISDVPLYNGDVQDAGFPPSVSRLASQIAKADGVLFISA